MKLTKILKDCAILALIYVVAAAIYHFGNKAKESNNAPVTTTKAVVSQYPAPECEIPAVPQTSFTLSVGGVVKFAKVPMGDSVEIICDEAGQLLDVRRVKATASTNESLFPPQ